jgi:hypothetical protein
VNWKLQRFHFTFKESVKYIQRESIALKLTLLLKYLVWDLTPVRNKHFDPVQVGHNWQIKSLISPVASLPYIAGRLVRKYIIFFQNSSCFVLHTVSAMQPYPLYISEPLTFEIIFQL